MRTNYLKAFTLVEMLMTLAISSIIIGATYSSYQMVANQYSKNIDVAQMHTSGRAIMRIIERDIRMAGFEYRDDNAIITYGAISNALTITDSGNQCCDDVSIVYDYFDEASQKVERLKVRYWTKAYSSNKGNRHRLYKQTDILGRNNVLLASPVVGVASVMADFIEDFQIGTANENSKSGLDYVKIDENGNKVLVGAQSWSCVKNNSTGVIWQIFNKFTIKDTRHWYDDNPKTNSGFSGSHKSNNTKISIENANAQALCGITNWRLPVTSELRELSSETFGDKAKIWKKYFPELSNQRHWSSVNNLLEAQYAWFYESGAAFFGHVPKNARSVARLISKINSPQQSLISINLTLRTKNKSNRDRQFKKKGYQSGNFKLDKTDKYKRDTFSTTVLVRNLAL